MARDATRGDRLVGPVVRLALALVLATAAASGPALAQEAPKPRPLTELVAEAESAFGEKKERPFAALVAAIDGNFGIDPWLVADGLAAAGKAPVARAFAVAGTGPRWKGLDVYVARDDVAKARGLTRCFGIRVSFPPS